MGFVNTGGIATATSFRNNSPTPLDGYSIVETRADLNLPTNAVPGIFPEGLRYKGRQVFVMDEGMWYYLKTGITDNDWAALGGGNTTISAWANGIEYEEGAIVWSDGQLWRCKTTHTSPAAPAVFAADETNFDNSTADVYTGTAPTLVAVGGIPAGTVLDGYTLTKVIDGLFFPDMPPVSTLAATPAFGYYEKGVPIASFSFNCAYTKTKNPITDNWLTCITNGHYTLEQILSDFPGVIITTPAVTGIDQNFTVAFDGSGIAFDAGLNSIQIASLVYDGDGSSAANFGMASGTYTFTNPVYIGSVPAAITAATITEADVKALTKRISANKAQQTFSLTGTDVRPVIAFPSSPDSYGTLSSILDPNAFEMMSSFTSTMLNVTTAANEIVSYWVFVLSNSTSQSSFNMTYKFS